MNRELAMDSVQIEQLLQQALAVSAGFLGEIEQRPPATQFVKQPLENLLDVGLGAEETMKRFQQRYGQAMPASNGPRFWGFVTGGATPAALIADWLVSAYDLNLSSAANSVAPNIELEALAWLRELFGLPDSFAGVFVSGATMANVTGLALGREWVSQQSGHSAAEEGLPALPPIKVLSGEAHSSVVKALAMLGMGRRSLLPVATLGGTREAVDVRELREGLAGLEGAPAIVVANAGTVNTVDFDDLRAIVALKAEFPFWLHVDAAFGGFAACSPRYSALMSGVEMADSVTIDAHKWLNVPYDAAMLFTRHRALQPAVFGNAAAYLGEMAEPVDFVHLGPENSRRMRALPAWFTLLAYGKAGYREIVERSCALAGRLGELVDESEAFELLAPVRMNVVCFTLAGEPSAERITDYLARLRDDGRVFLTPTRFQGRPAIRAALSNWRTRAEDVDIAWQGMLHCL